MTHPQARVYKRMMRRREDFSAFHNVLQIGLVLFIPHSGRAGTNQQGDASFDSQGAFSKQPSDPTRGNKIGNKLHFHLL